MGHNNILQFYPVYNVRCPILVLGIAYSLEELNVYPELFRMSKEVLESRSVGFYIDKNALWENDINTFIYAIREGGIYQKILDDHHLYRKERRAQLKKTAIMGIMISNNFI